MFIVLKIRTRQIGSTLIGVKVWTTREAAFLVLMQGSMSKRKGGSGTILFLFVVQWYYFGSNTIKRWEDCGLSSFSVSSTSDPRTALSQSPVSVPRPDSLCLAP